MFQHSPLTDDVSDAFRLDNCWDVSRAVSAVCRCSCTPILMCSEHHESSFDGPSSLRMYFSANAKFVSLRSTMRTLPKAPRPTTRSKRKWLRLAVMFRSGQLRNDKNAALVAAPRARHVGGGKKEGGMLEAMIRSGDLHVLSPVRSTGFP